MSSCSDGGRSMNCSPPATAAWTEGLSSRAERISRSVSVMASSGISPERAPRWCLLPPWYRWRCASRGRSEHRSRWPAPHRSRGQRHGRHTAESGPPRHGAGWTDSIQTEVRHRTAPSTAVGRRTGGYGKETPHTAPVPAPPLEQAPTADSALSGRPIPRSAPRESQQLVRRKPEWEALRTNSSRLPPFCHVGGL